MPDIDRLIEAWEIFRDSNPYEICDGREFRAIKDPEYCMGQMIEDTIALLKELEAVVPEAVEPEMYCVSQDKYKFYRCHACKTAWYYKGNYCLGCGRKVKWK